MQRILIAALLAALTLAPTPATAGANVTGAASGRVNFGDVSGLDGATKLTVMTWVNLRATTANGGLIWKGNATVTLGMRMTAADPTALESMVGFTLGGTTATGTVRLNRWDHWAMVYDGTRTGDQRIKVYRNGEPMSLTYSGVIPATAPNSGADVLYLGYNTSNAITTNGTYANFKVILAALSEEQVKAEVNLTRSMNTVDAAVVAPGKEPTAARMIDYSGRGNHGTYENSVVFSAEMPPVTGGGE